MDYWKKKKLFDITLFHIVTLNYNTGANQLRYYQNNGASLFLAGYDQMHISDSFTGFSFSAGNTIKKSAGVLALALAYTSKLQLIKSARNSRHFR